MKKRNMILGSVGLLAVLLVAGGTMAWFTATAEDVVNNFKAGTVKIEVNEEFDEEAAGNVNPGDSIKKEISIDNKGTKRAYIRVKLEASFGEELSAEGIVDYPTLDNWILHTDGYYYYKDIVEPGASTTNLIEEVTFKGKEMKNEYQGAEFTLTVSAEAIQASNGAMKDEWGVDPADIPIEVWVKDGEVGL